MTTNLLIFFALPLAVVIFSIALQKILKNPFLVSGIVFSVLLIIVLAFFDTLYLIAVIAYTILAFITAVLTCLIHRWLENNQIFNSDCSNNDVITVDNTQNLIGNYDCDNTMIGTTGGYSSNYKRRK